MATTVSELIGELSKLPPDAKVLGEKLTDIKVVPQLSGAVLVCSAEGTGDFNREEGA